jgi:hypothetical protein
MLRSHLARTSESEDESRAQRIGAEALRAFRALARTRRAVSLFGSARPGAVTRWGDLAEATSTALTRAGFAVITGGGPGIMEAANRAAARAGGASVGLTIQLPTEQEANPHLTLRVPFHYFFLRKLAFVKYGCAFVCLPGGFGTLDELFEALNLRLTHTIDPFPVILVGVDYWSGLIEWLRSTAVAAGTLANADLDALVVTDDPEVVVSEVERCHRDLCRALGVHG